MRQTKRQILGGFFTLVTLLYLGCVLSQLHTHIINGTIIVHAHPAAMNDDETGAEHTATELVFYHQISNITALDGAFAPVELPLLAIQWLRMPAIVIAADPLSCSAASYVALRAPPYCASLITDETMA